VSTLFNQNQLIVLIRLVNDILFDLDGSQIYKAFDNEGAILDPVMNFMKNGSETQTYCIEVVKTLSLRATNWVHQLISVFLSHTSIANADIVSIKQVPIYGPDAYVPGSSKL
jgi:hypothetical protein